MGNVSSSPYKPTDQDRLDIFAAMAMAGILANPSPRKSSYVVDRAYSIAKDMMAARKEIIAKDAKNDDIEF